MSTWATVKKLGKKLPEVEESTWFNTPSLKVRKKSFVRLREKDVIVVLVDQDEKEALLRAEPEVFFTTPHYDGYPAMLVRLSTIEPDELREVLIEAWRRVAPKRLIKEFDDRLGDDPQDGLSGRDHMTAVAHTLGARENQCRWEPTSRTIS